MTLALLRALGYGGRLAVVARRPLQAELARRLGASKVYGNTTAALDEIGASKYKPILGSDVYRGGYEAVIEAAGSAGSLEQASWAAMEGGLILLLGAAGEVRHDFSPHWFRELTWVGSYTYGQADFADAVAMLPELAGLEELVGPAFSLAAWPQALASARQRRVIKVTFAPHK